MENLILGIDLGTTFSAAAYVDENGQVELIRSSDGKKTIPSVVLVKDGRTEVGEIAMNQWMADEEHVVRWIKRAMGNPGYRFQNLSPVEISAAILKTIKDDAEHSLGQPVREAVITCPAYFNSIEIGETKKAGELAGFQVREVVKEPTAAAVYYGVENMADGETVMICDLGGGTYDATILTLRQGVFMPRATMGNRSLGGHDWTMTLVDLVSDIFFDKTGEDPRNDLFAAQKLYEDCEKGKRDLARMASVSIPCQYETLLEMITVTREEFESATEYHLTSVLDTTSAVLDKAGLAWTDIDRILPVGGSSRLRRLGEALQELSGITPVRTAEPDFMVAKGAAILARGKVRPRKRAGGLVDLPKGGLVDISYTRTIARSLGTRVISFDDDGPVIVNSEIIAHGTESPVTRSRDDYQISQAGQAFFDVPVVEFEDELDYDQICNYRFHCLPDAERGDRIEISFHYDESGIISVSAVDVKTGAQLRHESIPYEEPDPDELHAAQAAPRWVVFAIDVSGSMYGEKIDNARRGILDNARQLLESGGEVKIGIVSFNRSASIVCRPTSDMRELEQAVASLDPSGLTNMGEGLRFALDMITAAPAGTEQDIVLLTDGMPDSKEEALAMAGKVRTGGISLCALGVGSEDVDEKFLGRLTPNTLVIEQSETTGAAMGTLLTQAARTRADGLTAI